VHITHFLSLISEGLVTKCVVALYTKNVDISLWGTWRRLLRSPSACGTIALSIMQRELLNFSPSLSVIQSSLFEFSESDHSHVYIVP
jgi:hypothetical protein